MWSLTAVFKYFNQAPGTVLTAVSNAGAPGWGRHAPSSGLLSGPAGAGLPLGVEGLAFSQWNESLAQSESRRGWALAILVCVVLICNSLVHLCMPSLVRFLLRAFSDLSIGLWSSLLSFKGSSYILGNSVCLFYQLRVLQIFSTSLWRVILLATPHFYKTNKKTYFQ